MLEAVFPGGKKVDVIAGKFLIKTDQKPSNGGEDSAPQPFHIFLSSIVACAGIYAKSFCDSRNLNANGMKITQEVTFNRETKLIDTATLTLFVSNDFPEKYENPILKAMNACAVKKQLHPDITVESKLSRLS